MTFSEKQVCLLIYITWVTMILSAWFFASNFDVTEFAMIVVNMVVMVGAKIGLTMWNASDA